jgi:hypothetical protein
MFSKLCNVSLIEGHKGIKSTDRLCLYPRYTPSDTYKSINNTHVTGLYAINYDSSINHFYPVTDNFLQQTSSASLAILGSANS